MPTVENVLTKEMMKEEAIKRLKKLNVEKIAFHEFEENGVFYVSERMRSPDFGVVPVNYFLNGYTYEKEVKDAIRGVKDMGGYPYWGIVDHMRGGYLMISILFVSKYQENWEDERADEDGIVLSMVYNTGMDFSELGSIVIKSVYGGILRVG